MAATKALCATPAAACAAGVAQQSPRRPLTCRRPTMDPSKDRIRQTHYSYQPASRGRCVQHGLRLSVPCSGYPSSAVKNLKGRAFQTHWPGELPGPQPLQIQPHAVPAVPEDFDQVALLPPEAAYLATLRITAEPPLNLRRQAVHLVGHTLHRADRKGDHHGSSATRCESASEAESVV